MSKQVCSRCNKPNDAAPRYRTCEKCRAYNRGYKRHFHNRNDPRQRKLKKGLTCGRRHCSQCGHWRHAIDFAVARWIDEQRTEPRYFRHHCRTCERIHGRIKNAKRAGRSEPYGPAKNVGLTTEQRAARRRKLRNEWQRHKLRNDPEWAAEYREKQRFYAERRRRAKGVPVRQNYVSTYKKASDSELLDIKPFQNWIENRLEVYDSIEDFAASIHTSPRTVLRWRSGREVSKNGKERIINKIPLNTVDIAITREGNTALWEIYPELYE